MDGIRNVHACWRDFPAHRFNVSSRCRSDPAGLLAEQGPRAGELPTSEPGRKLLSTWHELVRRGDLFNDWTGIRARPLSETEQGPPMQR